LSTSSWSRLSSCAVSPRGSSAGHFAWVLDGRQLPTTRSCHRCPPALPPTSGVHPVRRLSLSAPLYAPRMPPVSLSLSMALWPAAAAVQGRNKTAGVWLASWSRRAANRAIRTEFRRRAVHNSLPAHGWCWGRKQRCRWYQYWCSAGRTASGRAQRPFGVLLGAGFSLEAGETGVVFDATGATLYKGTRAYSPSAAQALSPGLPSRHLRPLAPRRRRSPPLAHPNTAWRQQQQGHSHQQQHPCWTCQTRRC
jgi:hypothetical protein